MMFLQILFTGFILFIEYSDIANGIKTSFRYDYMLIPDLNSFYKYHKYEENWYRAKEICENEGASLFHPENEEHLKTVRSKFIIGNNLQVEAIDLKSFETFKSNINNNFSSTEEGEKCLLLNFPDMRVDSDCAAMADFVCQKKQASVQWNDECNMPVYSRDSNDYEYDSKLKKCYKLHKIPNRWQTAVEICKAEESNLAELNSQYEANHLVDMVTKVHDVKEVGVVCLGFWKKDGWRLLSGTLLRDSGYPMWAHTQPDGGEFEALGAMAYNGRLHDIGGKEKCIFVCEHDVEATRNKQGINILH